MDRLSASTPVRRSDSVRSADRNIIWARVSEEDAHAIGTGVKPIEIKVISTSVLVQDCGRPRSLGLHLMPAASHFRNSERSVLRIFYGVFRH